MPLLPALALQLALAQTPSLVMEPLTVRAPEARGQAEANAQAMQRLEARVAKLEEDLAALQDQALTEERAQARETRRADDVQARARQHLDRLDAAVAAMRDADVLLERGEMDVSSQVGTAAIALDDVAGEAAGRPALADALDQARDALSRALEAAGRRDSLVARYALVDAFDALLVARADVRRAEGTATLSR